MNSFLLHCRSTAGSTGQIFTNLRVAACRILLRITRWLIFAAACLTTASPAAADGPPIVRVEEDWRIEVGTPAPEDHAPQIVTVLSPVGNLEREHSVFELNHATYPNYSAGGMQLQRWYRNWISGYSSTPQQQKLYYANEVVTFTSSMTIDDGHIEFRIENGESKSWSTFGGNGYLKTQSSTGLQDLNAYSPNVSVANSRVAFASHRVRKLVLTKIRYYSEEGIVTTDDTPRIVHEYSPE